MSEDRVRIRLDSGEVVEGVVVPPLTLDGALANAAAFIGGSFLEFADDYRSAGVDKRALAEVLSVTLNRVAGGVGAYSDELMDVICDLYELGFKGWTDSRPPSRRDHH